MKALETMQPPEFIDKGILSQNALPLESRLASINVRVAVAVMFALSALIAIDRLYAPAVPINVDPASYAVVAHELLDGKNLYTDIWDHKPPAPFVTYAAAELAFGYSGRQLYILNFLASVAVLWGIFLTAKHGPGGQVAGLIAASLWAVVSGSFGLEGRDPNTELLINVFVVFAFYIIVANRTDGLSCVQSIAIGTLYLWASLYKPVVVANVGLITLAYVLFAENRKRAFGNALTIGAVGVVGWMLTFVYFLVTGRGEIFYTSIVTYNKHYSGNIIANVVAPAFGQADLFVDVIGPLAICALIGAICSFVYDKRLGALVAAFVASSWIALASAGRFSVHYYQLWLPPLIIASAWGIGYFFVSKKTEKKIVAYSAGLSLVAILIIYQLPHYRAAAAGEFVPEMPVLNSAERTVDVINSLLRDDESFYVWGNTPNLYLLANRRPAAGVLFDSHLRENPVSDKLVKKVWEQLAQSKPEILLIQHDRPLPPEWLKGEFESVPLYSDLHSYSVYARRGGRIAAEKNMKGTEVKK